MTAYDPLSVHRRAGVGSSGKGLKKLVVPGRRSQAVLAQRLITTLHCHPELVRELK